MTIFYLFISLFWVYSQSSNDDDENEVIRGKSVVTQTFDIMDENAELVDTSMSKITDSIVNPSHPTCDSEEIPTKLFLIYFCIADMSVELQSLGFYTHTTMYDFHNSTKFLGKFYNAYILHASGMYYG